MSTSAGLTKGGGLGMGPGYKNWLFNEQALFHTWFVGSVRNYWFLTTELTFPKLAGGKLEVGGHGYLRYWPRERYYGLGPRLVEKSDRTSFLREGWEVRGDATYKPAGWSRSGGLTAFRTERIDEGKYPGFPSDRGVYHRGHRAGSDAATRLLVVGRLRRCRLPRSARPT